jgi:hypothetical protein
VSTEQADAILVFSAQLQSQRNEMRLFAHFAANSASFARNKTIRLHNLSSKPVFPSNSVCPFRSHRRTLLPVRGLPHRVGQPHAQLLTTTAFQSRAPPFISTIAAYVFYLYPNSDGEFYQ